ncbi:MAG: hypothetical protein AAFR61_04155 [Bacteroidota bacterium]
MKKILFVSILILSQVFLQAQSAIPIYRTFSAGVYGTGLLLGYDQDRVYFLGVKKALQRQENIQVWVPGLGELPAEIDAFDSLLSYVAFSIQRPLNWAVESMPSMQVSSALPYPGRDWKLQAWLEDNQASTVSRLEIGRLAQQGKATRFDLYFPGPFDHALGGAVLNGGGQLVGLVIREQGQSFICEAIDQLGAFIGKWGIPHQALQVVIPTQVSAPPEDPFGNKRKANPGETRSEEASSIPQLAWPPPQQHYGWKSLNRYFMQAATMEAANYFLEKVLLENGYRNFTHFLVPNGFAVVCQPERIRKDLSPYPAEDRWPQNPGWQGWDLYKSLSRQSPGYYRYLVFVVRSPLVNLSSDSTEQQTIKPLYPGGEKLEKLQAGLSQQALGVAGSGVWAFVFPYEVVDTAPFLIPLQGSFREVHIHLERSGLFFSR